MKTFNKYLLFTGKMYARNFYIEYENESHAEYVYTLFSRKSTQSILGDLKNGLYKRRNGTVQLYDLYKEFKKDFTVEEYPEIRI